MKPQERIDDELRKEYLKLTLKYNRSILDLIENRSHLLILSLGVIIPFIATLVLTKTIEESGSIIVIIAYFFSLLLSSVVFLLTIRNIRTFYPTDKSEHSNIFGLTIRRRYPNKDDYLKFLTNTTFDMNEFQRELGGQIYKLSELVDKKCEEYQIIVLLLSLSIISLIFGFIVRILIAFGLNIY